VAARYFLLRFISSSFLSANSCELGSWLWLASQRDSPTLSYLIINR
jgi:hypothetical protein